jgi:two-component sensor histidine kinase
MNGSEDLEAAKVAISELRHRMKNMLTVVQALVRNTLASAPSMEEANRTIDERLSAIGRSVDLLLKSDWQPVELRVMIELALAQAPAFPGRVVIDGPQVVIEAAAVTPLVLALHELETNAIKYGALSGPSGQIEITWALVAADEGKQRLTLQWVERDGPAVTTTSKAGFGSRLATSLLQRQLGGAAELELAATGLIWRMMIDLTPLVLERP